MTLIVVAAASLLAYALWQRYMYSPWTRDGRVHAEVVQIAPDVSGRISEVAVRDNEFVRKGGVLFRIDPARYTIAVQQAQANLAAARASLQAAGATARQSLAAIAQAKAEYAMRRSDYERRQRSGDAVSKETRSNARARAQAAHAAWVAAQAQHARAVAARRQAQASLKQAQAALALAQLNLRRTVVRAPVAGYVTHLRTFVGDYAQAGTARIAMIDSHEFWVTGYFEETKLPGVHVGDQAEIRLLDGTHLQGTVESIARGISDAGGPTGSDGLANVSPTFSWVRLAQRIPVRIRIDTRTLPRDIVLAAGMTATIVLKPTVSGARAQR